MICANEWTEARSGMQRLRAASAVSPLQAIKLLHTVVWAFFAGCVLATPVLAWQGRYDQAVILIAIVLAEVLVLVVNSWRCPLTNIASRFTEDRRDNFDIYLPAWLARHNKLLFGTLYVASIAFTFARWFS
jgi:hypothetical protein